MAKVGDTGAAVCRQCANEFAFINKRGPSPQFCYVCRPECAARDNRERGRRHRVKSKVVLPDRCCDHCAAIYTPRQKNSRFCSAPCRVAYLKSEPGLAEARENCKATYWKQNERPARAQCRECGNGFLPWKTGISFCGIECRNKHRWRKSSAIRRARLRGAPRERFDPLEIFERDAWRCHMCGVKTLRRLSGTTEDRAPQLDHIVPLARGGSHTRVNTACSCRRCNVAKADNLLGQLRLIA